jgi:nitrite reductase/ring-hydroxylating ferredoxin subunit
VTILSRLFRRGRPVRIHGADSLPEGKSLRLEFGDPRKGGAIVILCRVGGRLHAVDAVCPHERGELDEGPLVDGKYVRCPVHQFQFDPRSGRPVIGMCPSAQTYRVTEKGSDADVWF